jgi:NTP pyrophosphatase (non-canonical NTP hydrolase)
MSDDVLDLAALREHLRGFVAEREWEQFHTPKNLAMAVAAEAGELLELFQWLTPEQSIELTGSVEDLQLVREELADILLYVVRLADLLEVNLPAAIDAKLAKNAMRYPVAIAKGNATKYSRRADLDR